MSDNDDVTPGAEAYDAVISTSSPALMAKMAPDLSASYAAGLQEHLRMMHCRRGGRTV